ncbi:MAG TPA: DUF3604 domain-containing protein [Thermoanaerobaculia bacterium]|nr:DUF3604 domain-containing protein [Thermoanaerobaculia bacterium]
MPLHRLPARSLFLSSSLALLLGCAPGEEGSQPAANAAAEEARPGQPNPLRNAYFGDLHVHSQYSFDAFIFNVRATPDDAYRYAKGESITHPLGFPLQLQSGPLDFQAVTDHAVYLGVIPKMFEEGHPLYELPFASEVRGETGLDVRGAFRRAAEALRTGELTADTSGVTKEAWNDIVAAAERHNQPGAFTTFAGFEYTSGPEYQNLHRNVIFRGEASETAFSRLDSANPEDLWRWLDARREEGREALAIPHNSNGSNGQMFLLETFEGEPFDAAYADLRMRNEPLVEITQVKGTSDTHPLLSPNDEWAEFEIFPFRIATQTRSDVPGSYIREAYLNGLEIEEREGFNPFRFGLIGSSDTHNGAGPVEEDNYFSKVGVLDGEPELRGSVPLDAPRESPSGEDAEDGGDGAGGAEYADVYYDLWSASGLAGIWAEENTRDSLYDAMRRKETFATSGPRIKVRFFAGYDYSEDIGERADSVELAYAGGVPMGGDLTARAGGAPRFLVWAMRDPRSAPLQRLQVIKGWVEDGAAREQVFDVACSDGGTPDAASHRCPDNGAAVDLADCSFSQELGAAELRTTWTDPSFDPAQRALYYVRVLENPTCRWSTWDALRAGVEPHPDLPKTIQERAWSSPIWSIPVR